MLNKRAGEVIVATNRSSWSWEYDQSIRTADITCGSSGDLFLTIVERHIKSGLGAGERSNTLVSRPVGKITKPDLKTVISFLAKYTHSKSSASSPFKRNWVANFQGASKPEAALGEILRDFYVKKFSQMADISPKEQLKEKLETLSPAELERVLKVLNSMKMASVQKTSSDIENSIKNTYLKYFSMGVDGYEEISGNINLLKDYENTVSSLVTLLKVMQRMDLANIPESALARMKDRVARLADLVESLVKYLGKATGAQW